MTLYVDHILPKVRQEKSTKTERFLMGVLFYKQKT